MRITNHKTREKKLLTSVLEWYLRCYGIEMTLDKTFELVVREV